MHSELVIRPEARRLLPLYAAGLGATSAGLAALSTAVNDTSYTGLTLGLLALGFCTSWSVRAGLIPRPLLERAGLVILGALFGLMLLFPEAKESLIPGEALKAPDVGMASVLAWLMVAYSYTLFADRSILFICVPALSLIGLISTFGPNVEVLAYFIAFMCFMSFALLEENTLWGSEVSASSAHPLRLRLGLAAGIIASALLIGVLLGHILFFTLGGAINATIMGRTPFTPTEFPAEGDIMPVASGPVSLSEREVMTVRCEQDLLWRGLTYDKYTGSSWCSTVPASTENPSPEIRRLPSGNIGRGWRIPWDPQFGKRLRTTEVEQTYHATGMRTWVIYGAAEPVFVSFDFPRYITAQQGAVRTNRAYVPRASYKVVSSVSTATANELRKAGEDYPEFIKYWYTRVPESCWQIEKTTERVIRGKNNAYGKVTAILTMLETEYVYDTAAPAAPPHEDAVTFFLLNSRRGYCDVFASALVIMCRQAGIPARVVSGYATGDYSEKDGLYHVRVKHRHAWAEVFFPGYGWITFNPAPVEGRTGFAGWMRETWSRIRKAVTAGSPGALMTILIAILLLYLVKTEILDRLIRRPAWGAGQPPGIGTPAENYRRMCRTLARVGYPRSPSTTPSEYAATLASILPPDLAEAERVIQVITSDFVEARYALRQIPVDRLKEASEMLRNLRNMLSTGRKRGMLPGWVQE